jgi:hypothetical protein
MGGSLYAGGSFTHHNGAPLTNLARWNGAVWEQIGALNGPVTAMTAARGVLHMVGRFFGVAAVTNSSYAQWNGREWSTLGTGLYGMMPHAVSVSDSGLVMACGDPQSPQSIIRLLIWRGEAWITPEKGTSLFDGTFGDGLWIGNDLYLAPEQPVTGDVESLGLACWHEREAQPLPRQTATGHANLRVTGATPAEFAVERTTDLKNWAPFATNAIGNPGQFFPDPLPLGPETFYRIREIK